MGTGGSFPRG